MQVQQTGLVSQSTSLLVAGAASAQSSSSAPSSGSAVEVVSQVYAAPLSPAPETPQIGTLEQFLSSELGDLEEERTERLQNVFASFCRAVDLLKQNMNTILSENRRLVGINSYSAIHTVSTQTEPSILKIFDHYKIPHVKPKKIKVPFTIPLAAYCRSYDELRKTCTELEDQITTIAQKNSTEISRISHTLLNTVSDFVFLSAIGDVIESGDDDFQYLESLTEEVDAVINEYEPPTNEAPATEVPPRDRFWYILAPYERGFSYVGGDLVRSFNETGRQYGIDENYLKSKKLEIQSTETAITRAASVQVSLTNSTVDPKRLEVLEKERTVNLQKVFTSFCTAVNLLEQNVNTFLKENSLYILISKTTVVPIKTKPGFIVSSGKRQHGRIAVPLAAYSQFYDVLRKTCAQLKEPFLAVARMDSAQISNFSRILLDTLNGFAILPEIKNVILSQEFRDLKEIEDVTNGSGSGKNKAVTTSQQEASSSAASSASSGSMQLSSLASASSSGRTSEEEFSQVSSRWSHLNSILGRYRSGSMRHESNLYHFFCEWNVIQVAVDKKYYLVDPKKASESAKRP